MRRVCGIILLVISLATMVFVVVAPLNELINKH